MYATPAVMGRMICDHSALYLGSEKVSSQSKKCLVYSRHFFIIHIGNLKIHTVAVIRLDCLEIGMLGNVMEYTFPWCKPTVYCWMSRSILIFFSTWEKRRVNLDCIKAFCSAPHPRNSSTDGAPLIALSAITLLCFCQSLFLA